MSDAPASQGPKGRDAIPLIRVLLSVVNGTRGHDSVFEPSLEEPGQFWTGGWRTENEKVRPPSKKVLGRVWCVLEDLKWVGRLRELHDAGEGILVGRYLDYEFELPTDPDECAAIFERMAVQPSYAMTECRDDRRAYTSRNGLSLCITLWHPESAEKKV